MNLYQIRSHIKLIAEMLRLSKDSRIKDGWIDFIVANHRSRGIRETYGREAFIDPTWLQDFGVVDTSCVNSADDPNITYTSKKLAKVTLPTVVSLPEDKGVYRIANSSKLKRYFYTTQDEFFAMVSGSVSTDFFNYYFRVGNSYYMSDNPTQINFVGILDDPMQGVVLLTERIGQSDLVVGQNYTVYQFQIVHNSVAYNPGATFTAVSAFYTGNGYVKFTTQKRDITDRDEYPMSKTMLDYVLIQIFTVDFGIEKQQVADVINDAAVQEQLNQNINADRSSGQ